MKKIDLPIHQVRHWIEIEKKQRKWVARQLGVSYDTIKRNCQKHDIKFRWPIEKIRELVETDGLKHWEVGDKLGIDRKYVSDLCKKHGVKSQRRGPRGGPGHPDWEGGRIVTQHGYILIYFPGHPYAKSPVPYVQEHRLVMEKHLGRYLDPNEIVHHKNKDTLDNRLENLVLMTRAEHSRHHYYQNTDTGLQGWRLKNQFAKTTGACNQSGSIRDAP